MKIGLEYYLCMNCGEATQSVYQIYIVGNIAFKYCGDCFRQYFHDTETEVFGKVMDSDIVPVNLKMVCMN